MSPVTQVLFLWNHPLSVLPMSQVLQPQQTQGSWCICRTEDFPWKPLTRALRFQPQDLWGLQVFQFCFSLHSSLCDPSHESGLPSFLFPPHRGRNHWVCLSDSQKQGCFGKTGVSHHHSLLRRKKKLPLLNCHPCPLREGGL